MKYSTSLKVWNNIAFADENSRLWHHRYDKTSHNWSLQCSVNAGHELWSISNRKATFSMKRPLQNTPAETPFESWGMKTKSTFRGLLQFIVITGDSSKENQHGKPEWLWRLPHSSLKEPEQAVWIGWLILRLIQQWKLNIGPTWEEPVWIWPWSGYGHATGLVCLIRGHVYLLCRLSGCFLSMFTRRQSYCEEENRRKRSHAKPHWLINKTHLALQFNVWGTTLATRKTQLQFGQLNNITTNETHTHIYKLEMYSKTDLQKIVSLKTYKKNKVTKSIVLNLVIIHLLFTLTGKLHFLLLLLI